MVVLSINKKAPGDFVDKSLNMYSRFSQCSAGLGSFIFQF